MINATKSDVGGYNIGHRIKLCARAIRRMYSDAASDQRRDADATISIDRERVKHVKIGSLREHSPGMLSINDPRR